MSRQRPIDGETLGDLIIKICRDPIPAPSSLGAVPVGFDAWFARATQRLPSERFDDVSAMASALESVLNGDPPGSVRSDPPRPPSADTQDGGSPPTKDDALKEAAGASRSPGPKKSSRWRRWALVLGGVSAMALLGVVATMRAAEEPEQPEESRARQSPDSIHRAVEITQPVQVTRMLRAKAATFAPDGMSIAFVLEALAGVELWISDRRGHIRRILTAHALSDFAFHPDGASVLWSGKKTQTDPAGTFRTDLDGTPHEKSLPSMTYFTISTAGDRLWGSQHEDSQKLKEIDLASGQVTDHALELPGQWIMAMDYAPLDELVLLQVTAGRGVSQRLVLVDAKDTSRTHALVVDGKLIAARFAPSGHAVLTLTRSNGKSTFTEHSFDPDTLQPNGPPAPRGSGENMQGFDQAADGWRTYTRAITQFELKRIDPATAQPDTLHMSLCRLSSPQYSPDGKTIAVANLCEDEHTVVTLPAVGGQRPVVIGTKSVDSVIRWSPSGDRVALFSSSGGAKQLWLLDAKDGGPPRLVGHAPPISDTGNLSWAPHEDILVQQPGNQNFSVVGLGEEQTTRALIPRNVEGWCFCPVVHPNRKHVALAHNSASRGRQTPTLFSLDATEEPKVLRDENITPIRFRDDGSALFGLDETSGKLVTIRLPSGDIAQTYALPPKARDVHVKGDGTQAVYVSDRSKMDVWISPPVDATPPPNGAQ